ncbi:MAG: hypothetical protein NTV81_04745 [Candidatus Komeilibacteria bacterium]|nr:hypothetical protein [Candidatus Komeilibacteria bacterium]
MLLWIGLYLGGLILIFTIGDCVLQWLNRCLFLRDEEEDYYNQLPLAPFWQQYWLDLLALGDLRENWRVTITLLLWPISLVAIVIWAIFELRQSLVNYLGKISPNNVIPPRPIF